jgi:hypothetical protein
MSRRSRSRTFALVTIALLAALTLIGAAVQADTSIAVVQASAEFEPDAPPPPVINYQGRLVDPGTGEPLDGLYNATFGLYPVDVGGSPLWEQKKTIEASRGLFSVTLGDEPGNPIDPALFDGYGRWLSIIIDPDGELLPRIRVAHAPYAIWSNQAGSAANAANADRFGGQPPAYYALATHTHDAAAITSGSLAYAQFNAYGDLANDGRIGPGSSMVAAGIHDHKGTDIVDGSIGAVDLADASVTSAKIADGNVANADLANNSVTSAKIADGAVTAAKLASGVVPKFFTLNIFGAFLGGGTTLSTGYGPYAGMRLPDNLTPEFSFAFTIPPDYTSGTNLTVRFIWHTPATSCGIVLAPNYMSVSRAGRTQIVGGSVTSGMTMVGGTTLSAPATANQSSAKDLTINTPVSGTNLVAGDSIIFGLYRSASSGSDTCANYLAIQGVSVSYQ